MGRTAWRSVVLGALFGSGTALPGYAHAQAVAPTAAAPAPVLQAPATPSPRLHLPQMPSLRLAWPITPLRFSFSGREEGNYANGPLRLFRAESLWLKVGALQGVTVASAERDFELDCSGLTCQPVVKNSFAVEGRLALPRVTPQLAETYAYVRSSWSRTSQPISPRNSKLISVGLAGAF